MVKFDQNWKIVDLQNECKRLKISYGEKKADLIKRLNKLNSEKFYRFHIIALAVSQKLVETPIKYIKNPVVPKAKVGRKTKAKKCLDNQ
ncbi:hypothetical protein BpHYR1_048847 [Brachionus plicatilis]|uniref:SAP domain-containing protein n=1 Tax=Brachionus plicatilis TaxID=10195 RepID=A0A3M7QI56_BRAPC|nr:hypothetical protein BpHYR1_048847 [Brachionus plicatilis]